MTDTTMRADFEQHIRDSIVSEVGDSLALKRLENGDYWAMWVADRWVGWQAATERAAPQWQPIETAPRDGTEILVYSPPVEAFSVKYKTTSIAWWVLGRLEVGGYWGTEVFFDGRSIVQHVHNCTHWVPLPPPPAIRQGGDK